MQEGIAPGSRPPSFVRMLIRERVQQFGPWMESRFQVHVEGLEAADTLEAGFQSLRDGTVFVVSLTKWADVPCAADQPLPLPREPEPDAIP